MLLKSTAMKPTRKPPNSNDSAGSCPRCHAYANFVITECVSEWDSESRVQPKDGQERFLLCKCNHCKRYMLVVEVFLTLPYAEAGQPFSRWVVRGAWPRAGIQPPEHVPEDVAELYREASVCLGAGCFRASALMTRACLEATLKDREAKGNTLFQKIESLERELRPQLLEIAKGLKDGGNAAGHSFSELITRDEAEALFAFLGQLLKELYERPQELGRLKKLGQNRPKR